MQTNYLQSLEEKLGVKLPNSYKNFILQKGSAIIDGYSVVGLPTTSVSLDAEKATNLLRYRRPDLPLNLVAVIPAQKFVCCLDIAKSTQEDAPLVEVDLENIYPPKPVGKTFSEWISYHEKLEKRFMRAWTRVGYRQAEAKGSSDFSVYEFKAPFTIEGLCKAINTDNYNLSLNAQDNTIERLNELLKTPDLYDKLRENKNNISFSVSVTDLVTKTSGYRNKSFLGLISREQRDIKRLNRFLIEETYPQQTPKNQDKGGNRIQDWSAPIFRVKDYIFGIGAFRFSFRLGCLEVDEFYPINQAHVKEGEPVKILLSETLARARDYCGSLRIQFTKDIREDENGSIRDGIEMKRLPAPIPQEVVYLARRFSINLPQPEKGMISHNDACNLWFASLELPREVEERVFVLKEAGYLKKEIVAEIISLGYWAKEEVIWIFLNAPRPEVIIMGSDPIEDRISYVESLNYGRAAIIANRLKYALLAIMNDGFSLEEIEEAKIDCEIVPLKDFWLLKCTDKFQFPELWLMEDDSRDWFKGNEPVLLLCRPHMPGNQENEMKRLREFIEILSKSKEKVQAKCLVLGNEFSSPYYCKFVDEMKRFVEKAKRENIHVIFAPARTDLYLDEDIHKRMQKVRSLSKFPSRQETKKIEIIEVPPEWWKVPEDSKICRAIQSASQSALNFAQQIVRRREVKRYEMEFSLMCEVIEREASQNHKTIAEIDGEQSRDFVRALRHSEPDLKNVSFSFVTPEEMPKFLGRIKDKDLQSILKGVHGGIVAVVRLWETEFLLPKKIENNLHRTSFTLLADMKQEIDASIKFRKEKRIYASNWNEIDRAHILMRESLEKGVPFPIASILGKVRSGVFTEMIRDYIYERQMTKVILVPIAYGDGSQGGPFFLFSLPKIEEPNAEEFFGFNVGLVSLRHQEADKYVDRCMVRNRDIQNRENGAEQEELTFRKTYECLDELLRFIRGEIGERDNLTPSLRILLGWKPKLKERSWNGLNLNVFHTTGLESAGIGAYKAILDIIKKYQGEILVTPRILIPSGDYKKCQVWF